MAGEVKRYVAEWLIIAFVAFALLFEVVLHKLEHWVMHRHPHIQTMLRNIYRELMILGIISFCFIMYIFTGEPGDDIKMTFEVAHVFIFLFACFHTFVVGLCIFLSLKLSKRWLSLERIDLVNYLELKEKYQRLNERREKHGNPLWRHLGWWFPSPVRYAQFSKLHEAISFHDVRYQFIYYRNLSRDFRFSKYLRKIKFATFVELVEIHPVCWLILIAFILLDLLRHEIGSNPNFEACFLIAHSVFNVVCITIIARKIRRVYYKLTKNPATYYDNIDPTAFRKELAIAEEELKQRSNDLPDDSDNSNNSGRNVRFALPRKSRDAGSADKPHYQAIHHNMAYVPDHHGAAPDVRYSIDVSKAQPGVGAMNPLESYDNRSGSKNTSDNLVETAKRAHENRPGNQPMLIGMATAMPMQELDHRARPSIDIRLEQQALHRANTSRKNLRMEALRRLRAKERSAAIVETAQDQQAAERARPRRQYHWLLVKMFPRLGRVASAAEKLFWFGSHRFYLFCVELFLFFTNINLSTAIAKLSFNYKERSYYKKKLAEKAAAKAPTVVKTALTHVMRAAATAKDSGLPATDPREKSLVLLWIAFGMGLLAMVFVLLRIADIMKKYIFVLNNANLLPETMTTQTIHTISLKDAMEEETMRGHDTSAKGAAAFSYIDDSDTDADDFEEFSKMRRNLSNFFETEGIGTGVGVNESFSPGISNARNA